MGDKVKDNPEGTFRKATGSVFPDCFIIGVSVQSSEGSQFSWKVGMTITAPGRPALHFKCRPSWRAGIDVVAGAPLRLAGHARRPPEGAISICECTCLDGYRGRIAASPVAHARRRGSPRPYRQGLVRAAHVRPSPRGGPGQPTTRRRLRCRFRWVSDQMGRPAEIARTH